MSETRKKKKEKKKEKKKKQKNENEMSNDPDDLPRALIKRLMKHEIQKFTHFDLSQNSKRFEPSIAKDALDAVQQAAKIFIHYVTSTANDICLESKRSTVSAVSSFRVFCFCFCSCLFLKRVGERDFEF